MHVIFSKTRKYEMAGEETKSDSDVDLSTIRKAKWSSDSNVDLHRFSSLKWRAQLKADHSDTSSIDLSTSTRNHSPGRGWPRL